jgi:hypothetical protein
MNNYFDGIIDLGTLTTNWDIIWNDPIGWFLGFSLIVQILIVIVLIAIAITVLVLVYYILKGVAYLLYYLFKGLYYLFKGIYMGLSKLFDRLYYGISGKPGKKDQNIPPISKESIRSSEHISHLKEITEEKIPYYCTECGQKITGSLNTLLNERGVAFCFFCGKEFTLKKAETS